MCVCVCGVCVCVCVPDREGSWAFDTAVVVVVPTAVYLTGYSDCLTGFREPLSPLYNYICYTGLKKMSSAITVHAR